VERRPAGLATERFRPEPPLISLPTTEASVTKLLDRVLGLAAKADASAGCPPDPYTEARITCSGSIYVQTCYRSCSTSGNCTTHCGSWGGCRCVSGDAWICTIG
jgi:hypothetical protein